MLSTNIFVWNLWIQRPSLMTIQQVAKHHEDEFLKLKHFSGFWYKKKMPQFRSLQQKGSRTIEIIWPFLLYVNLWGTQISAMVADARAPSVAISYLITMHDKWIPVSQEPFYQHGLTFIPAWISNYIQSKVHGEITYPFPNFNDDTVEVWEWISNFIPDFTGHAETKVIPC